MIVGNALNSLILWNFFPMHMRGIQPTFTDRMHGILAINPFVLVSLVLGAVYYKNWFRYYSIATILLLLIMVVFAIPKALLVYENKPTPGLGIMERASQYRKDGANESRVYHFRLIFSKESENLLLTITKDNKISALEGRE